MSGSNPKTRAPLWLLVMITISGTLGMHMFVPALPAAAHGLGASSAAMQMTISVYILGLAAGQLVYGPLSDSLGRRPMLIAGLGLYTAAGLAAAIASGVHALVAARLFQALGGCAGLALGRAIVRDTTRSDEAVGNLALLNLMIMVGPGLAPLLGSALTAAFGWRSIFLLLAALGGLTLLFAWRLLPETGQPTGSLRVASLARDYGLLLRSPAFLGYALGGGCATTSIYAFIAAAPFIFSLQLQRPAHEVGFYLGLLVAGMSLGNALTRVFVVRMPIERLLIVGNSVSAVSAFTLLAIVVGGELTVVSALACMFLFAVGAGVSSPTALAKALSVNSTVIGSAAGLYGFTQMGVGALCTSLASLGGNPSLTAAIVLAAAAVLAQAGFWSALRAERTAVRAAGLRENEAR